MAAIVLGLVDESTDLVEGRTLGALVLGTLHVRKLACGKKEGEGAHKHTKDCYGKELTCGKEKGQGAHKHTDACYKKEKVLVCEYADVHIHSSSCFDAAGHATCGFVEIQIHTHSADCFKTVKHEEPGHQHTEACYEKVLVCELPEHQPEPDEYWEQSEYWDKYVEV